MNSDFSFNISESYDMRIYIKFRDKESWRNCLQTITAEADGKEYTLLEISEVFKGMNAPEGMMRMLEPIGQIFDVVNADEDGMFCFIHDNTHSMEDMAIIVARIFGAVLVTAENDAVMIADITSYDNDEFGDKIYYYLGGGRDGIKKCTVEGLEGLQHHDEIEIADFSEMLKYETLTPDQKEYLQDLTGGEVPENLMMNPLGDLGDMDFDPDGEDENDDEDQELSDDAGNEEPRCVFCRTEVKGAINCIDEKLRYNDFEITVNIINVAYMLKLKRDGEKKRFTITERADLYPIGTEIGALEFDGKGNIIEGSEVGPNAEWLLDWFKICEKISAFLQNNGLTETYEGLDPGDGIHIWLDNGEIKYKTVSGSERPDLMCMAMGANFFAPSQPVMMRPYMDDFMSRSTIDMMDIDEKEEAAEEGDKFAMAQVALAYLNGDGVEQDAEKAAYWYGKLADNGDSEAAFNLGLMYAKGFGVDRNFIKAAEYMEKARDYGDTDAEKLIEKFKKAAENKEKAEAGDAQGQADYAADLVGLLGSLDQAINESKADVKLVGDLAKNAIDSGVGDGYYAYALMTNFAGQKETTLEFYKKGADMGSAKCIGMLGKMYLIGDGVEVDNKLGFKYSLEAAEKGIAFAMVNVARCYQFAIGVNGNMKTATEWYIKALETEYNPELEQRVETFTQLSQVDPDWGKDYEESDMSFAEQSAAVSELANSFGDTDFGEGDDFEIEDGVLSAYYGDEIDVVIPDGVTEIAEEAFAFDDELTSVIIPDGVNTIGEGAFAECVNLKSVKIPASVKKIAKHSFDGCEDLTVTALSGSYAEKYAKKNNFKLNLID